MMRLWDENPASLGAADQEHPRAARRRCGACSPRRTPILVPFGAPGRICNTPLLIDPGCRAPPRAQGGSALAAKLVSNHTHPPPLLLSISCPEHVLMSFSYRATCNSCGTGLLLHIGPRYRQRCIPPRRREVPSSRPQTSMRRRHVVAAAAIDAQLLLAVWLDLAVQHLFCQVQRCHLCGCRSCKNVISGI